MTDLVRSACLSNYAEVARAAGLDPYAMLHSVDLSQRCLTEPDLKIPTSKVRRLLEDSAALSGMENFGLRMAETRRLSILGPLGMLARDAPTVRSVLAIVVQHMRLHNESLLLHVEDAGPLATIRQDLVAKDRGAMHQTVELSLGALMRLLRLFLAPDWTPVRVCLVHQSPVDISLHRKVLGTSLEFGCEFDGIICKSSDLDTPIATSDPVLAAYARKQFETVAGATGASIERDVRQLVLLLLPTGRCSVDNVARHLNVDRRTVHRQLAKGALSFSMLVNQARDELSHRYLGDTQHSLADIALLLGFSGSSAYSRWHQSQCGSTPTVKRNTLQQPSKRVTRYAGKHPFGGN